MMDKMSAVEIDETSERVILPVRLSICLFRAKTEKINLLGYCERNFSTGNIWSGITLGNLLVPSGVW